MIEPEVFEIVRDTLKFRLFRITDWERVKMWDLYSEVRPSIRCGQIAIQHGEPLPDPAVKPWVVVNIWVWFDLRGRGIMREFVPKILQHYNPLCSGNSEVTSPHAHRMWQALKASTVINPYPGVDQIYVLFK